MPRTGPERGRDVRKDGLVAPVLRNQGRFPVLVRRAVPPIGGAMNDEVQRYVNSVPADRRPLFDRLHALIMKLYPEANVLISYQIPTYRAKSGWVALGVWKGGVSLYTDGPDHIAEFKAAHPAVKTGKGSIKLSLKDTIPEVALVTVIRHAIEGSK